MFQNNILILVSLFFGSINSFSQPCDETVGVIKSGEKSIVIELKTEGQPSRYITEDDGILALSFVAAYCHSSIPRTKVELDESQTKCAQTEQDNEKVASTDRVQFNYDDTDFERREKSIRILQQKCSIDAKKLWSEAHEKSNDRPLDCVEKVRGIVKKALARHSEFINEQTPQTKVKGQAVKDEVQAVLASQKAEHAYFQELADMFSETPVKTIKFKKWIERMEPFITDHSYSVIDMSKDKIDLSNQEDLTSILFMARARLPFLYMTMCGGTMSADLIDSLSAAIWQQGANRKVVTKRDLKNEKRTLGSPAVK